MKMSNIYGRTGQLAMVCTAAIMMCHTAAAQGQPLQPPTPSYPLYCQGPLHTTGNKTPFKWASKGAAEEAPGPGKCAWYDRGPRGSEIKSGDGNVLVGNLIQCNANLGNLTAGKYLAVDAYRNASNNDMDVQVVIGPVKPPFTGKETLPLCAQPK